MGFAPCSYLIERVASVVICFTRQVISYYLCAKKVISLISGTTILLKHSLKMEESNWSASMAGTFKKQRKKSFFKGLELMKLSAQQYYAVYVLHKWLHFRVLNIISQHRKDQKIIKLWFYLSVFASLNSKRIFLHTLQWKISFFHW